MWQEGVVEELCLGRGGRLLPQVLSSLFLQMTTERKKGGEGEDGEGGKSGE